MWIKRKEKIIFRQIDLYFMFLIGYNDILSLTKSPELKVSNKDGVGTQVGVCVLS